MLHEEKHSFARMTRFLRSSLWFLIIVLVVMGILGKRGWMDLRRMHQENARLEKEIKEAQVNRITLAHQILSIQKDPQMQEHMIRKVLGYIKANETVIEF